MKNLNGFDNLDFNSIECSKIVFNDLVWRKNKILSILVIVISVIGAFFLIVPNKLEILAMITLTPFLYFYYFSDKAQKIFIRTFAEKNNLEYQKSIAMHEVKGSLFEIGHTRRIINVVRGGYQGQEARFFYYSYSVNHGKGAVTFPITVLEIFFEKVEFPYIFLQSKKMSHAINFDNGIRRNRNEIKVNLGDELKRKYTLFVRDGYGIEAMQIFTPEFLDFLVENNSDFSIEFSDNRMYVYHNDAIRRKKQLESLFNVTKKIIDKIGPLLNRLENDFSVLHKYHKK
jgi:hypothetical protein